MSMQSSDSSETAAELVFWYWNDKKEIAILQVCGLDGWILPL
jgi:hypothetical protein